MKKIAFLIGVFCSVSCTTSTSTSLQWTVPSGATLLGIAPYFSSQKQKAELSLAFGTDPLLQGFIKETADFIVAPINLGAKFYQQTQTYALYQTYVWGNLYLLGRYPIPSLQDLNHKTITVFSQQSTPDIVLQALTQFAQIDCTFEYVSDVATANARFLAGRTDYCLTAEPALSKLNLDSYYTLDLQEEWKTMTGIASYPQAGIFVRQPLRKEQREAFPFIDQAIASVNIQPHFAATQAIALDDSLANIGLENLIQSIPNCNFRYEEKQKEAITFYFQKLIDLGFSAQIGGDLPDASFYLSI